MLKIFLKTVWKVKISEWSIHNFFLKTPCSLTLVCTIYLNIKIFINLPTDRIRNLLLQLIFLSSSNDFHRKKKIYNLCVLIASSFHVNIHILIDLHAPWKHHRCLLFVPLSNNTLFSIQHSHTLNNRNKFMKYKRLELYLITFFSSSFRCLLSTLFISFVCELYTRV